MAEFGITGLQTVAHDLVSLSATVDWEILINAVTKEPRKLLGLHNPSIQEGSEANVTLLDPKSEWLYNSSTNKSKSENTPYWQSTLKGRVVATFGNGKSYIAE